MKKSKTVVPVVLVVPVVPVIPVVPVVLVLPVVPCGGPVVPCGAGGSRGIIIKTLTKPYSAKRRRFNFFIPILDLTVSSPIGLKTSATGIFFVQIGCVYDQFLYVKLFCTHKHLYLSCMFANSHKKP